MFLIIVLELCFLFVSGALQVNNATARVVTKKPQTPLVNGDISSKTFHWFLEGFCFYLLEEKLTLACFPCSLRMEDQPCHGSDVRT